MAIRNGQLKRLRNNHPKLFKKLLIDTPMGKELMRAKDFATGSRLKKNYSVNDVEKLLKQHPDAFNTL